MRQPLCPAKTEMIVVPDQFVSSKQAEPPTIIAVQPEEDKFAKSHLPTYSLRPRGKTTLHVDSRRPSIAIREAPTAEVSERPKTLADRKLISVCLSRHFIFSSLTEENRETIINQMKHYEVGPREIIFEQEQPAVNFFVLATGKLEVIVSGISRNIIKSGEGFGELALLHDAKRSATIKTIDRSTLWGMDRQTFRQYVQTVNMQNYEENKRFFSSIRIFQLLTDAQRESLLTVVNTHRFKVGHKIVNEGDPGEILYVIKEGAVLCTQKGQELRRMEKGEFFGELALLHGGTRTATVTAIEGDAICLSIGREDLRKVLGNHLQQIIYVNTMRIALERSQFLRRLTKEQRDKLIQVMRVASYRSGQVVAAADSKAGSTLWIVLKGTLRYSSARDITAEIYTCIGDDALSKPAGAELGTDIICASEEADVADVSREQFEACIGGQLLEATVNNEVWKMLKQVQMLRGLSMDSMKRLIDALQVKEFQDGEEIVRQNNPGDSLYIIKSGKVDVYKDGVYIRSIMKHDYFGERSALFNDFRSATVVAHRGVTCWVLQKEDFLSILDEGVRSRMKKRIELQNDRIKLNELMLVTFLSRSGFGSLFLAKSTENDTLYALKCVNRKKITMWGIEDQLALERKILLQLDHSMIIKLVKTFKDSERLYFLMEYVRGIEMFELLKKRNAFSDAYAKFYSACVITILEHLHERDIIHRDITPENLLIDEEGYVKLVDFSKAKIVPSRTFSIVGSPHYMAPEVITGKGYGPAADLWSLGVMIYEFFCGVVPFGEEEEDPIIIYEKILEYRLVYASYLEAEFAARPLVEQLLSKNPAMRLGSSFDNLKNHPWFADFDWDKLMSREMQPPYKPVLGDNINAKVNVAFRRRRSFNSIIAEEESEDEMDGQATSFAQAAPVNWDHDF